MKKMKKTFIAMTALLGVAGLAGCTANESNNGEVNDIEESNVSGNTSTTDNSTIRVAVMPFLNSLPIVYMEENGLDEKHGFDLETVYFASGGPMNEALGADLWDMGILSAASVYSLANYDAKLISDVAHSEGGIETLVREDSDILSVQGANSEFPEIYGDKDTLSGKTIAVPTGTISHLNVDKWLEAIDVDKEDVNVVHMEFPQAYQALIAGKVDVAALNPPTSFEAEEKMVVTSSLSELEIPQFDSVIVNNKFYDGNTEQVTAFVKAFYEANDALMADIDMAAELLNKWYDENGSMSTVESAKEELERRPLVTLDEARKIEHGKSVQVTADFFEEQGLIQESQAKSIPGNIDREIIEEVIK